MIRINFGKKAIEISKDFAKKSAIYGWVFGFGKKAKIISPPVAVDEFKKMVDTLSDMYTPEETE